MAAPFSPPSHAFVRGRVEPRIERQVPETIAVMDVAPVGGGEPALTAPPPFPHAPNAQGDPIRTERLPSALTTSSPRIALAGPDAPLAMNEPLKGKVKPDCVHCG